MKFPNHVLLDINVNFLNFTNQYWTQKHFLIFSKQNFIQKTFLNYNLISFPKQNLFLNTINSIDNFTITHKFLTIKKNLLILMNSKNFNNYHFNIHQIKTNNIKKKNHIDLFFYNFKKITTNLSNNMQSLFNINFLKKEKIYTKLKYSRVPQYDIVSGGVAAIFAGFLGFLICEKFGFELLDSGDFYFFFMYIVFFFFFLKLFIKILNTENQIWNIFTLKWLFFFINNILILLINFFKLIIFKLN